MKPDLPVIGQTHAREQSVLALIFARTLISALHGPHNGSDLDFDVGPEASLEKNLEAILVRLWQAAGHGDVCIDLTGPESDLLAGEPCARLVGDDKPLVLQGNVLYMNRFWHAEERVSEAIRSRLAPVNEAQSGAGQALTQRSPLWPLVRDLDPTQCLAVQTSLNCRLSVIHGGPGTGKTKTIASLLACYAVCVGKPVWIAAPTAKAGARMMESLSLSVAQFSSDLLSETDRQRLASFVPTAAMTVQRLLTSLPDRASRQVRAINSDESPDQPGMVVIDEASMLSLDLCDQIFSVLDPACQLVLVGDPNQLHSVETGSVFSALCQANLRGSRDFRVKLDRNFRQADRPGLSALARAILTGEIDPSQFDHEFKPEVELSPSNVRQLVEAAASRYAAQITQARAVIAADSSPEDRARAYLACAGTYRLISARRTGYGGADRLSQAVLEALRKGLHQMGSQWFEGQLITITRNDYSSGLFNGDTGVCIFDRAGAASPRVLIGFERQGVIAFFQPSNLPEHQHAYCLSVHQAQGSEFGVVDFLPAPAEHPLATRELVYTAVTRARMALRVHATFRDIQWACTHPTRRRSDLHRKLEVPAG